MEAGADFVGADEFIPKIQGGWTDVDVIIATPDLMGEVGKLGRTLGPRGLMPNPKSGTVTFDVAKAVKDVKAGKVEYRVDKNANLHIPIGKGSFTHENLLENLNVLIHEIVRAKPARRKGRYIKSLSISSTMGRPSNWTARPSSTRCSNRGAEPSPAGCGEATECCGTRNNTEEMIMARPEKDRAGGSRRGGRQQRAVHRPVRHHGAQCGEGHRAAPSLPGRGRRPQSGQEHAREARHRENRGQGSREVFRGSDRHRDQPRVRERRGQGAGQVCAGE